MATACGDEDHAALRDVREAVRVTGTTATWTAVQSFTGQLLGTDVAYRTEAAYRAPDDVRWLSDRRDAPFQEAVILNGQAWVRDDDGWREEDAIAVKSVILEPLLVLQQLPESINIQRVDDGPQVMGEPTQIYRFERDDYGAIIISQAASAQQSGNQAALDLLREAYRDVTAQFELTVGQDSKRIYMVVISQRGPNQAIVNETAFAYDQPVIIEPPIP